MSEWVTVEIGVALEGEGDPQQGAEDALHAIRALLSYEPLPIPLTVHSLLVRRGSPGDRWSAFTDVELRLIGGSIVAADICRPLYDEIAAELERRNA